MEGAGQPVQGPGDFSEDSGGYTAEGGGSLECWGQKSAGPDSGAHGRPLVATEGRPDGGGATWACATRRTRAEEAA